MDAHSTEGFGQLPTGEIIYTVYEKQLKEQYGLPDYTLLADRTMAENILTAYNTKGVYSIEHLLHTTSKK